MTFNRILMPILAVAVLTAAPAFAQNRFMDEAKAAADRRAENKAVREAEHPKDPAPDDASTKAAGTATASTATPVPAETAPAAQSATPAAPATPATPAAPATPKQ